MFFFFFRQEDYIIRERTKPRLQLQAQTTAYTGPKENTRLHRLNQQPKRVTSPAIETDQQKLASASRRQSYTRPLGHVWRSTTKRQHVSSLPRLELYRREKPPEQHHLDPRCVGAPDTDIASAATTSHFST